MLRFLNKICICRSGPLIGPSRRWMSVRTTVMSFGDASQGALGLHDIPVGLASHAYEPTPIPGLPPDVCGVAAGHYHSLALTSNGQVWAWGRNAESQLGRSAHSPRETLNKPQKVDGLDKVMVQAAFASGVVSAAIGDDGALWVWGRSKRGQLGLGKDITEALLPARVESLLGQEIVKVSFGWGHALALTKDGKLFGWGYYADGRLGTIGKPLEASPLDSVADKVKSSNGNPNLMFEEADKLVLEAIEKEKDMPIIWEPTLIEEVNDAEVADIACGLDHSLVLCSDGTLLSGGSNVYGQLGRANEELGLHVVDMNLRPISIASGMGHSLAICKGLSSQATDGGTTIVTWGWNQCSQLGREGLENVPLAIESLVGEMPASVFGGRVHSIAVTEKREVWSWGCGRNGRLGLGSSADETEPMLIEYLEGVDVLQAAAGFDHNLVLVQE